MIPSEQIIDPRELRIGNYLEYEGKIVHVTMLSMDIDDEYEEQILFCELGKTTDEKGGWNRAICGKLTRIKITSEWLRKLGFRSESPNDDSIVYCLDNFYVDWTTLQPLDFGVPILNHKIEFVHQLQNLYFVWTKQELTIKSP